MLNYKSLFGTTDLTVDEANITNLTATNITSNTVTSNTVTTNAVTTNTVTASGVVTAASVNTQSTYTVTPSMTTAQINAIINNTQYNVIEFQHGTYYLTSYLNIARDNVVIRGNRATLYLNDNVLEPNLFIGDMTTNPPTITYYNIIVNDFIVFGNRINQQPSVIAAERSITHPWIYNNGIGINLCRNVVVRNCVLYMCRSGGFTATYDCKYITVDACYVSNNFFDGLTAYGSENIIFSNNHCIQNNSVGISIDINIQYAVIHGNTLTNNGHGGVFARHCHDVTFSNNIISANSGYGLFLSAEVNASAPTQGCDRWSLCNNSISNNAGHGIDMHACQRFSVTGNTIYGNGHNGINVESFGTALPDVAWGICSYNCFSGNSVTGNADKGFYNDSGNSYTNGARYNYLTYNVIQNNTSGQVSGDLSAWILCDDVYVNTNVTNTIDANVSNNVNMTSSSSSHGIYSKYASSNSGGIMMDAAWGNLQFKGGYYGNTFAIADQYGNRCLDVYNNGTNKVSINSGSIGLADGTGSTVLKSASSGSAQTIVFPSSAGSSGNFLKTDGAGNTTWGDVSVVSATDFHIGDGLPFSGTFTYDGTYSNASSAIVTSGSAQTLPSNPLGYICLTIAGQGTVAIPYYTQSFFP